MPFLLVKKKLMEYTFLHGTHAVLCVAEKQPLHHASSCHTMAGAAPSKSLWTRMKCAYTMRFKWKSYHMMMMMIKNIKSLQCYKAYTYTFLRFGTVAGRCIVITTLLLFFHCNICP
ncbi:unnamed protein product [Orchesella dallaii]|uniref:Uncharacterized protein n=1 Tax=Orchesella dallaii TaxID=48710 RepID=A0ABP1S2V4_9HEXA